MAEHFSCNALSKKPRKSFEDVVYLILVGMFPVTKSRIAPTQVFQSNLHGHAYLSISTYARGNEKPSFTYETIKMTIFPFFILDNEFFNDMSYFKSVFFNHA